MNNEYTWLNSKYKVIFTNTLKIGAHNAFESGYDSYTINIPSGYKTTGICSVLKGHPAYGEGFYIIATAAAGYTVTLTDYFTYGTVTTVPDNRSDFTIGILVEKY